MNLDTDSFRLSAGYSKIALVGLVLFVLMAAACSDDAVPDVDDGLLWTIENAISVGFEKTEELRSDRAKALDAWAGTFNGVAVELYRHRVTDLGVDVPVDPTWLHGRMIPDDCCNFWQRNRLTAICALGEQACKGLSVALEEAFPL
jgi:hypothetical protein|tara:strand:- start:85 stop:522 length:438 start_codon:yes stop_codon:yes gene_type:complete